EAPGRVGATLADLAAVLPGETRVAVCRELTKLHEQIVRTTLAGYGGAGIGEGRGEHTLIVEAAAGLADEAAPRPEAPDSDALRARVRGWLEEGQGTRRTARRVAELRDLSKAEAYSLVETIKHELTDEQDPQP